MVKKILIKNHDCCYYASVGYSTYRQLKSDKDFEDINIEHEKPKLTPQQEYNNKVLTIFQKIDLLNAFAGGTDVNWFHNLNVFLNHRFFHLFRLIVHYGGIWPKRN